MSSRGLKSTRHAHHGANSVPSLQASSRVPPRHARRRWSMVATWVVALSSTMVASSPGDARRIPAPGGKAVLAIPNDLVDDTLKANQSVPLLERVTEKDRRSRIAPPPLTSNSAWRSQILDDVIVEDGGRRFRVKTHVSPMVIVASLSQCFHPDEPTHGWPAYVLRAAKMAMEVTTEKSDVVIVLDRPFGAFLELIAGCAIATRQGAPFNVDRRTLIAQRTAIEGMPSLERVEVRADAEDGDVVVGGAFQPGAATVSAPYADILLLIPSTTIRESDPLGIAGPDGSLRAFHAELRPDLLANMYWNGPGGAHQAILPAGLAPARPMPEPALEKRPMSLSLAKLEPDAPRISVSVNESDALVMGVVERLAVLLRSRGFATDVRSASAPNEFQVIRWRPKSDDPALALLALAGEHPALFLDESGTSALDDPRLFSASLDERVAGAIALERTWLEGRHVVPLLYVQVHYVIDPALRGIRIRHDGVLIVDDAYWSDIR